MSLLPTEQRSGSKGTVTALFSRWRTHVVKVKVDHVGLADFAAWCSLHRGHRCEIALWGSAIRVVAAPAEAGRLAPNDLALYARRMLDHYFNDNNAPGGGDWALAASSIGRMPLACGVSRSWTNSIRNVAASHGVTLRLASPWWCDSVAFVNSANGAVAAVEPGWGTIFQIQKGRICRVWTQHLPGVELLAEPSIDWRSTEGDRRLVRLSGTKPVAATAAQT